SATATAALRAGSVSHAPATAGRAGTETLSSTSAVIRSAEKAIPATAAALGVLSGLPARSGPSPITVSVMGLPLLAPGAGQLPRDGEPRIVREKKISLIPVRRGVRSRAEHPRLCRLELRRAQRARLAQPGQGGQLARQVIAAGCRLRTQARIALSGPLRG